VTDTLSKTALAMAQMMVSAMPAQGVTVTRERIAQTVDSILAIYPALTTSEYREPLIEELETRFHVWIGNLKALGDNTDHVAWLQTRKPEFDWSHWNRYRLHIQETMAPSAIDRLDEMTDDILGRLEFPGRPGAWSRRGIVVGHVQSGKTANYVGLINKAVDAGYKIIIVLAGMHRNLRAQTQIRLDEGFLGYVSSPPLPGQPAIQPVGVGRHDPSRRPDSITNRRDDGDFTRAVAQQFNIGAGGKPLLFVIKKNASVLKNLLEWVEFASDGFDAETGRRFVRNVPLLVIDDEADQASVDTREMELDENGMPDPEHDPAIINARIRTLLHRFERNAYVGYTATPFANIYIHERAATAEHGEDLFPRSFIVNVPAPSNYFGPGKLFGTEAVSDRAPTPIRLVSDHVDASPAASRGWMPPKHRNGHLPRVNGADVLPPSLGEAVRAFVLATAARHARGNEREHHSMLVHVTRFTVVQRNVWTQVVCEIGDLRSRWRNEHSDDDGSLRVELQTLWESDFGPGIELQRGESTLLTWRAVESHIGRVLDAIEVKEINGTSADVLAYQEATSTGLTVIAIGGDKLARGLTLEGLSVSYFLRAASMYDTLMQMGRWFGYRPRYEDLCRLYMTAELRSWFGHITLAAEELREQFDHMVAVKATPREYGLKVQSHPVLLVTSRVKSRHAVTLQLSYSGDVSETIAFHTDRDVVTDNLTTMVDFLAQCGSPIRSPEQKRSEGRVRRWEGSWLWNDVPAKHVINLLKSMTFHPEAVRVKGDLLARYITEQQQHHELVDWTVALVSVGTGEDTQIGKWNVGRVKRTDTAAKDDGYYRIKRLLSPDDESIDLDAAQYGRALQSTRDAFSADRGRSERKDPPDAPSGPALRRERSPSRGLLLVYPLKPDGLLTPEGDPLNTPVMGLGLSFPGSNSSVKVEYKVNSIYYEQEIGELA